ncbi:MAG: ATP-dependent metallopeptidase FtsH/Yme1/Tma family protein, partial [Rikenellaceae bacterium]
MVQKKQNKNKFDLSWFWIIAIGGIVFFGMLGGSNSPSEISKRTFVDSMLRTGNISKVVVEGGETPVARVYVKPHKLDQYRQDQRWAYIPDNGYQFYFGVANSADFEREFNDTLATSKFPRTVSLTFEEKQSSWGDMLLNALPLILIIVFSIFMIRRMSGGGSGSGGGGGVFSVGKAKARLFDKENDTKVTFKDVAGLEEAKV